MLRNYFITAWRNLAKGKSFSVINISGLAIGMAGAVLILFWLQNEVSFDKFHKNKNSLYEVYCETSVDGKVTPFPYTSQPLGPFVLQNYPGVQNMSRFAETDGFLLTVGDKRLTGIDGSFVDTGFLQMFSFPLAQGGGAYQLRNINSIVITQKLAKTLFGNADALGKTIKIDSTDMFTVTGVLQDLPANSRFTFDYLLPWPYLQKTGGENTSWESNSIETFVQLKPGTTELAMNAKVKNLTRQHASRKDIWTHFVYPLANWHLYGEFDANGQPSGGRIDTVRLFGVIAVFILLIACINFMNLSTARSEKRAKEVGIRKVAGAGRGLLIRQFLVESFLTAIISGALSLLIVQLALPAFNAINNTQLSVPYGNMLFWLAAGGFVVFTSLLAGSYPAFYLSSFQPASILKGKFKKAQSKLSPRKVLVVVQFTFAIVLIICTMMVQNQIRYAQDRPKGYSQNNLVYVNFSGDIAKNYALIKQDLLSQGVATAVTKNLRNITRRGANTWGLRWPGFTEKDKDITIVVNTTDADLLKTTGLQLLQGRDIDIFNNPADSTAVLLNETAVKTMGLKNPVGSTINNPYDNINWRVVGVVKDFVVESPYEKAPPMVIEGPKLNWFGTMQIKFNPARTTEQNLAAAETIFRKYNPAYPFDYQFVDTAYAQQFESEQRTKTLAGLFATLAIVISCLGLFGLSAYVAESRIKEIGIRKVLGASVAGIAQLLSVEFVKLVFVSILIATPIAWYAMDKWLQSYDYRITLGWGIFALAGLLAVVIAIATVSWQSIKAAMMNPVRAIKSE